MYGKLGHGNESGHSRPCLVSALKGVVLTQIACGSRHTIALSSACGACGWFRFSTHSCSLTGVCSFSLVAWHVLMAGDNHVYTWGDQENGVAGHGELEGHQYVPRLVEALREEKTVQVAACGFHTAALTGTSTSFALHNQCAFGGVASLIPFVYFGARVYVHVHMHVYGMGIIVCVFPHIETGRVYTWGEGKFGRLGHGDEQNKSVPTLISSLASVKIAQVACGGFHSAATSGTINLPQQFAPPCCGPLLTCVVAVVSFGQTLCDHIP